jgi:hypothetical protein
MIRWTILLLCGFLALGAEAPKDLKGFGVVGDGKTDDTAAIQKAVDAGLGEIRFGQGTYRITRPVIVHLDRVGRISISGGGLATIVMAGAGPAFRIVGTHAGTAAPQTVTPAVWARQHAPMIDGIEVVGEHREAVGLQIEGTIQPTITRVVVRNALHGIVLTGRNRNVIISNCHIYGNRGVGVLLDNLNLHQINVLGSHISYNGGGGIVIRRSEVRNIQIGTSDIEANMDPKGPPAANILFDAREGSILEGAITGCTIQHNHEGPDSANIRFIGRSAADPNKLGNLIISNNAMSDVSVNVHLRHVRGVSMANNTFWKGYRHHMLIEGSSNILIGQNILDRNPDYKAEDSVNNVVLLDTSDSSIRGLHFNRALKGEAPLVLRRCQRVQVSDVMVLDSEGRGVLVDGGEDVQVSEAPVQRVSGSSR